MGCGEIVEEIWNSEHCFNKKISMTTIHHI
jgi:hypothetical protein